MMASFQELKHKSFQSPSEDQLYILTQTLSPMYWVIKRALSRLVPHSHEPCRLKAGFSSGKRQGEKRRALGSKVNRSGQTGVWYNSSPGSSHRQGCRFPPSSGVFSLLFVVFLLVSWFWWFC